MEIVKLENEIMEYAWGSHSAIPDLLGTPFPSGKPQAELWMGAHSKASSHVIVDNEKLALNKIIENRGPEILGPDAVKKFGGRLPYLFKVLAAGAPLSIQAHPDRKQAQAGFVRENEQQIPLTAFNRNYKDGNHKPEIICALSPFWAMNGFRAIDEILFFLEHICPHNFAAQIDGLKNNRSEMGLKSFFEIILTLPSLQEEAVVEEVLTNIQGTDIDKDIIYWIKRLNDFYPKDIGIISPVLLNLVCLAPSQAMYLPSGQLHAYLEGLGIELMANSDNVLRGGLTPKHVDVPELMHTLSFASHGLNILSPEPLNALESIYRTDAEEFRLTVIRLSQGRVYQNNNGHSAEIYLCTNGEGRVEYAKKFLPIKKGESFLIPAVVTDYEFSGELTLYKASIPI